MKRIIIGVVFLLFFAQPQSVSACAIATFSSPLSEVTPAGKSDALLIWDGISERLIFQANLKGDAQEFGMAFAFPSRPSVQEAPRDIFSQLDEYTKPLSSGSAKKEHGLFGALQASDAEYGLLVQELEKRDVGDFTVSVLQAEDAGALVEWLLQNQYSFSENDKENFEYYVAKGGYYFVALKVRSEARGEIPSYLSPDVSSEYALSPIEFEFETFAPVFPLRLARDDDPIQKLRLYTVSRLPLVVWGGDISFAEKMDWTIPEQISALDRYGLEGQWLTAFDLSINPANIEEDLALSEWEEPYAIRLSDVQPPIILKAERIPVVSGVVLSQAAEKSLYKQPYPSYGYDAEKDLIAALLVTLVFILFYIYISSALFFLARRFHTRRAWLAWIPFVQIYIFAAMAKKGWWFVGICIIPIIGFVSLLIFNEFPYNIFSDETTDILLGFNLYIFIISFVGWFFILERIMTSLVKQRGCPLWWGPASVLVPPLGLVFLGVLAWGKDSCISESKEALAKYSQKETKVSFSHIKPTVASPRPRIQAKKKTVRRVYKSKIVKSRRAVSKKIKA